MENFIVGLVTSIGVLFPIWVYFAKRRSGRAADLVPEARRSGSVAVIATGNIGDGTSTEDGSERCILKLDNRSTTVDAERVVVTVDCHNGRGAIEYGSFPRIRAGAIGVDAAAWPVSAPADRPPFAVVIEWADGRRRRHRRSREVDTYSK